MAKKASRPTRGKRTKPSAKPQAGPAPHAPAPAGPVEPAAMPRGDTVLVPRSEPHSLDKVRVLIRDEIGRQHAIEKSRQPLEMVAEASIRLADEALGPGYVVVDATGAARTKTVGNAIVPFTLVDLVDEMRVEHPNLFGSDAASEAGTPSKLPILKPEGLLNSGHAPTAPAPMRVSAAEAPKSDAVPNAPLPAFPAVPAPAALEPTRAAAPVQPPETLPRRRAFPAAAEHRPGIRRRAPLLPPAWMPSRAVRLRALYLVAFLGGLAAYGAVRHFA